LFTRVFRGCDITHHQLIELVIPTMPVEQKNPPGSSTHHGLNKVADDAIVRVGRQGERSTKREMMMRRAKRQRRRQHDVAIVGGAFGGSSGNRANHDGIMASRQMWPMLFGRSSREQHHTQRQDIVQFSAS